MRRRTFDILMSTGGIVITLALVVAGVMAFVGYSFANDNVTKQLSEQKISFPAKGAESLKDSRIGPYLSKYAGQQLTNGAQAQAYADHFIAVHLREIGGGLTYSQLSAKALADPNNTELAGQVATVFKGETLRGLLLNAYGFWKMGQIVWIGAIVSFAGAALLLILSLFGVWHLRRAPETAEVFPKASHDAKVRTA